MAEKLLVLTLGSLKGLEHGGAEASRGLCLFMNTLKSQKDLRGYEFTWLFDFLQRKVFHHFFPSLVT